MVTDVGPVVVGALGGTDAAPDTVVSVVCGALGALAVLPLQAASSVVPNINAVAFVNLSVVDEAGFFSLIENTLFRSDKDYG